MTLEELLEKETIKELRVMYCHYFDGKMIDDLVDLFTDDAVCEFGPDYGGDWVGKDQIREISQPTPRARVRLSAFCTPSPTHGFDLSTKLRPMDAGICMILERLRASRTH